MKNKKNEESRPTARNQGKLVPYFIIFVIGFVAGVAFTVWKGAPLSPPSTGQVTTGGAATEMQSAILNMEARVTANPDDYQAWVQLGHLYYDSDQPDKAIKAYTRSLEMHDGDANLLTDLGTMYRRAGKPEEAVKFFDQAITKDPSHLTARFNKGVVLMHDLNDPAAAIASWEEAVRLNPGAKGPNGTPLRELIDEAKNQLNTK